MKRVLSLAAVMTRTRECCAWCRLGSPELAAGHAPWSGREA